MKINFGSKSSKQMIKLFARSALITLGCVAVAAIGMAIAGRGLLESVRVKTDYEEYVPKNQRVKKEEGKVTKQVNMKDKTVMIFGVDKDETRTDTILLAHFDSTTKKVNIVSIPRDTKVYWTDEQKEKAKELNRLYQDYCKITEMSSYGGIDNLRYFTIRSVEEMLDVKVDNYVVLNTKVVREIVDSLGGIEVDVPRVMQYDDDYQDLHIDLQPGLQLLNGAQAEGLLRWRHNKDYTQQYGMGDLGRIETQQLFISAFMNKVINDVSIDTIAKLVSSVYKNVKTDVSFTEALSYVNYLPNLSINNLKMNTLPGEPKRQGKWYFIVDELAVDHFVDENILGVPSIGTTRTKIPVVSGNGYEESYEESYTPSNDTSSEVVEDDYNEALIEQEKEQEEAANENVEGAEEVDTFASETETVPDRGQESTTSATGNENGTSTIAPEESGTVSTPEGSGESTQTPSEEVTPEDSFTTIEDNGGQVGDEDSFYVVQ